MSDQTPIEKAIEALEASKSGLQWYAENAPEHYSEADAEHMVLIDEAIGGLAVHVEAQRVPMIKRREGPALQMQDVLLACGELNKRERVAVQWVLDRANAQRPGKVLTDEEVGRIAWKCYPHIRAQDAGRNADMATKRSAGIELLRYARDNGYLAPAQPLSAQQVFDVVEEFIKQEAERVGTDQPTGLEYPVGHRHWNNMIADLRERLNKLLNP